MHAHALEHGEPALQTGRQEMLENLLNEYLYAVR
jgi:xylose isomerase